MSIDAPATPSIEIEDPKGFWRYVCDEEGNWDYIWVSADDYASLMKDLSGDWEGWEGCETWEPGQGEEDLSGLDGEAWDEKEGWAGSEIVQDHATPDNAAWRDFLALDDLPASGESWAYGYLGPHQ